MSLLLRRRPEGIPEFFQVLPQDTIHHVGHRSVLFLRHFSQSLTDPRGRHERYASICHETIVHHLIKKCNIFVDNADMMVYDGI